MKCKDIILLPNVVTLTPKNSVINFRPAFKYKIRGLRNVFRLPPIYAKMQKSIDKSLQPAIQPNSFTKPTNKDLITSKLPPTKTPKVQKCLKIRNKSKLRITSSN